VWDEDRARLLCRGTMLAPIWEAGGSIITCKRCEQAASRLEILEYRPRSRKR